MTKRNWPMILSAALFLLSCATSNLTSTPLAEATGRGDVPEVRRLLSSGADPDEIAGSQTPLMVAAARGHRDVVSVLLEAKADVNAQNHAGNTALTYAARYGHAAVIEQLIEGGADVNLVANDGWPPLFFAAATGQTRAVEVLIEAGAIVDHQAPDTPDVVTFTYDNGHFQTGEALIDAWPGDVYRACLPVETRNADAKDQEDPKLAAHYLCRIVDRGCREDPRGDACGVARSRYGL